MFSVVITTKDRVDFLLRCVSSIKNNSITPSEVIIINDAGVFLDLDLFTHYDLNFTIVNNEQSQGANFCRNLGVKLATNDIVFFIDDDDAFLDNSFKQRVSIISQDENVGLCFTGVHFVLSNNLSRVVRTVTPFNSNNYFLDLIKNGNIIGSTSRVAIRKRFFELAGGFDENLSCLQDYDMWIRMSQVCTVLHDSSSAVYYTVHDNGAQISSKYINYISNGHIIFEKYKSLLVKYNAVNCFKSEMYFRVALSASSSSFFQKIKFAFMSFCKRPRFKSFALIFMPYFILKRIHPYA